MEFYQYEPIIQDEHGFRIVRLLPGAGRYIHVEIIHASFDESDLMEYDAVSYVWGSPELISSIIVGGKKLNVTQNLELVLQDLRLPEQERYLWIDGICIDQEKDKERNHQVRQMGTIYQRAELVLFHLGRSNDLTPVVQEIFEIYQEQHKLRPEMTFESVWFFVEPLLTLRNRDFEAEIRVALRTILEAPWFRRIWIIQEVANARRALLHWGSASLPVALFVQLVRGAEASHDHDKIFALMGMCADGKGHGTLVADYSKGLDLVIRETIAYMGFCDAEDIDVGFCSTSEFFNDVDTLLEHLLVHLAENERLASLESLLLNRGDQLTLTGLSPIGWAAMEGEEDIVKILFDFHADVEAGFFTPLFLAAKHGRLKIVKILLDHGANIDYCDDRGRTPLSIAASAGNEAILSGGHSKTGIKAIDNLIDKRNKSIPPIELIREHFVTSLRKKHWPNHRLRREPTTWRLTVFSKEGADPYRGDEPCSQLDLELSDNPRAYSQIVELLLYCGADVNSYDMFGLTPLWWAVNWGHLPVVRMLLRNKAFIEEGGSLCITPLSWAIWNGHRDVVQMLLDNRATVHTMDFGAAGPFGGSPLFWAICNGAESQVLQVLSHGMQVHGDAAIELAILEGHFAIVQLLFSRKPSLATQGAIPALFQALLARQERIFDAMLEHGFDTEVLYKDWTPLTLAADEGCFTIVQRLLGQANPNFADGEGRTALMVAVSRGFADIAKLLIEKGADVHTKIHGWTALQRVAYDGRDRMVKLLLKHGADIEVNNSLGTPLFLASLKGHSAVVNMLLEHNANVHSRNGNGETALLVAAKYDYGGPEKVAIARLLLKHGANIDTRSDDGITPIMCASCEGYTDLVNLLLSENANVDIRDLNGYSALDWSVERKHREIEQMLREKRGDHVLEVPGNVHDMSN
ncbi:hypothetical protein G7054_g9327 [Neopestalotiopsis clavispora]|nr:hypothetical protein G7054_g9327 [Neopestalotiopsis clavispora]